MSAPITRPLGDNYPSVKIETTQGGSTSSRVETHVNHPLPWIVLLAIVATSALCLSAWSLWVNLDNRRILAERIADANQAAAVRDRDIRAELQLNRNHVDGFDNRVIVLTKLEENYHAGRHERR